MAQSSPEGIVFDKDSALIKMEVSVNEEPIIDTGKDTADYIDRHIVEAMVEVAKNEITLEDVFNDEKKKSLKKFIDKHKQETLEEVAENELRKQNWDTTITLPFNGGFIEGFQQGAKWQQEQESKYFVRDLEYWKDNAEEDYITTPISVLRYISELEKEVEQDKGKYSEEDMKKCWDACLDFNKPAGFDNGIPFNEFLNNLKRNKLC